MKYYDILNSACNDVGIGFDENKYNAFIKYKSMIQEWNKKINLTAIIEDEDIIKKHFIDCIKIYKFDKFKKLNKIMDVGTGAGFPGIPIKILEEEKEVILLDSLNKRIKFLDEVSKELKLENIKNLHGRAEDYAQKEEFREQFDGVVSRAVANISVLSEFCLPYIRVGGYFIAMKGPNVSEEIDEGKKAIELLGGKLQEIIQVEVEESDLKHNLVIIEKIKNTPNKYPRKAGMVTKKPLK